MLLHLNTTHCPIPISIHLCYQLAVLHCPSLSFTVLCYSSLCFCVFCCPSLSVTILHRILFPGFVSAASASNLAVSASLSPAALQLPNTSVSYEARVCSWALLFSTSLATAAIAIQFCHILHRSCGEILAQCPSPPQTLHFPSHFPLPFALPSFPQASRSLPAHGSLQARRLQHHRLSPSRRPCRCP